VHAYAVYIASVSIGLGLGRRGGEGGGKKTDLQKKEYEIGLNEGPCEENLFLGELKSLRKSLAKR